MMKHNIMDYSLLLVLDEARTTSVINPSFINTEDTRNKLGYQHNGITEETIFRRMMHIRSYGKDLREEFEHNISLQMYVSDECWNKVKRAREETGELYKVAFTRVKADSSAAEYAREILHLEATVGNSAIREAVVAVRTEMAKHF